MKKTDFHKIFDEGRADAFLTYANSYNFEPRWNRRDTFIYSIITGGLLVMVILAIV